MHLDGAREVQGQLVSLGESCKDPRSCPREAVKNCNDETAQRGVQQRKVLEHAPCTIYMRMLRLVVTVALRTQRYAIKHKLPNRLNNVRRRSGQEGCHVCVVAMNCFVFIAIVLS